MSRRTLGIWTALAVLGAVLAVTLPAAEFLRSRYQCQEILTGLDRAVAQMEQTELAGQQNLSKWYNRNLLLGSQEIGDAYASILNIYRGAMGYLEVDGEYLPIFHGEGEPVGHVPESALPVGGKGNHTVLTLKVDLRLQEGDLVCVVCLGKRLTYRVESVQGLRAGWSWERPNDGTEDMLTLVWDKGRVRTLIRCRRTEGLLVEAAELEGETFRRSLLAAALTPLCCVPSLFPWERWAHLRGFST